MKGLSQLFSWEDASSREVTSLFILKKEVRRIENLVAHMYATDDDVYTYCAKLGVHVS